jgi:ribonuclease HI
MPVVECDPEEARERLTEAGVSVETGNTDHEVWRASHAGSTLVAYDGKVVVQGGDPQRAVALLRGGGGRAHVYFDGACRGNPGPASVEYAALVAALEAAVDAGFDEVEIRGDSQLIVKQVRGEWNTNDPDLREQRVRVHELLREFDDWSIDHVPREINDRADELANEALDGN